MKKRKEAKEYVHLGTEDEDAKEYWQRLDVMCDAMSGHATFNLDQVTCPDCLRSVKEWARKGFTDFGVFSSGTAEESNPCETCLWFDGVATVSFYCPKFKMRVKANDRYECWEAKEPPIRGRKRK